MNGQEDVSINNAIARRATLKEKKSGGTRIHSFPFRTVFSEDVKFIDAVYEIRDKQNELFRHANYDPTEYFAYRSRTYPQPQKGLTYEPMSLTYQPMTLQEKGLEDLGGIQYKTKWYPNGMTTQAMYLTVMHRPEVMDWISTLNIRKKQSQEKSWNICITIYVKLCSREQKILNLQLEKL